MPVLASWPLLPESLTPTNNSFGVSAPSPANVPTGIFRSRAFLGCGLVRPFRRDQKRDFANECGEELVRAAVGQVLGTMAASDLVQGELPWRTDFGSLLYLLMYDAVDEIFEELARVYVQDALRAWEPRVIVTNVEVFANEAAGLEAGEVQIRVLWDLIGENVDGNDVIQRGLETTLVFGGTGTATVNYQVGSNPV